MMGNMQMMKQLQKMQAEMARVQEELGTRTVEAAAGGGVVVVTVSGHLEVRAVKIDPAAIDPDDHTMLEDLVTVAMNEGIKKAQTMAADAMAKITGGLKIPGLM